MTLSVWRPTVVTSFKTLARGVSEAVRKSTRAGVSSAAVSPVSERTPRAAAAKSVEVATMSEKGADLSGNPVPPASLFTSENKTSSAVTVSGVRFPCVAGAEGRGGGELGFFVDMAPSPRFLAAFDPRSKQV